MTRRDRIRIINGEIKNDTALINKRKHISCNQVFLFVSFMFRPLNTINHNVFISKKMFYVAILLFSQNFDIDQAYRRIKSLDYTFLTEQFSEGIRRFSDLTGHLIAESRAGKSYFDFQLSSEDVSFLKPRVK